MYSDTSLLARSLSRDHQTLKCSLSKRSCSVSEASLLPGRLQDHEGLNTLYYQPGSTNTKIIRNFDTDVYFLCSTAKCIESNMLQVSCFHLVRNLWGPYSAQLAWEWPSCSAQSKGVRWCWPRGWLTPRCQSRFRNNAHEH